MDNEQNAEIIRRLYKEATAPVQPPTVYRPIKLEKPSCTTARDVSCLKTFQQFFASINKAFPVYALKIESLISREDQVMVRFHIQGTQTGDFHGMAPTRQPMMVSGIDVFRLNNGRVVEHWDAAHQINALSGINREAPRSRRTRTATA